MIPFALVDIKYDIFETSFFEKIRQINKIQDFTKNFKHSFNDQPTIVSFTTLNEKYFLYFFLTYQMDSKQPTCFKHKTVQSLHFPQKNTKFLLLKNIEPLFIETPQT